MSFTTTTYFKEVDLAADESIDVTVGSPMEFDHTTLIVRSDDSRSFTVETLIGQELQGSPTSVSTSPFTRKFTLDGLFPPSIPPKKRTATYMEPDPLAVGFRITNTQVGVTNRIRVWLTWQMCRGAGG